MGRVTTSDVGRASTGKEGYCETGTEPYRPERTSCLIRSSPLKYCKMYRVGDASTEASHQTIRSYPLYLCTDVVPTSPRKYLISTVLIIPSVQDAIGL